MDLGESEVPQGSVLGLFYFYPILMTLLIILTQLFANNAKLFSPINTENDTELLQYDILANFMNDQTNGNSISM